MDRLFESLEDNMKDAYLNQIRYAEALQILHEVEAEKINEMKFSFTEEIENVIKDRWLLVILSDRNSGSSYIHYQTLISLIPRKSF